ncbi:MAG: M43 family zinc metalloprotease [Ferruginibacter sp.]
MRTLLVFLFVVLSRIVGFAQADDGRLVTIPVIFHIIYIDTLPDNGMSDEVRNGEKGNNTTKLPREKILAELTDLDKDFQRENDDIGEVINEYKSAIGNARIHFILNDILYIKTVRSTLQLYTNLDKLQELSPIQSRETCLNVYISTLRYHGRGTEGVTTVPIDNINAKSDAVNLNYSWVGLHYRLLSHEVGHWLGLWHVDEKSQLTIDEIGDIPVQTDLTDIPCVKCTKPSVKVIREQRSKFANPNTNNFMDYSGCRRMFSAQQSNYMRGIIIRLRKGIWNNMEQTTN